MKKLFNLVFITVMLLSTVCLTNCKKDEPVTPTPVVTVYDTCKSIISDLPTNLTETTTFLVSNNPCEDLYALRNHVYTIMYVEPGIYASMEVEEPFINEVVFIYDENRCYKYNGTNWQPL